MFSLLAIPLIGYLLFASPTDARARPLKRAKQPSPAQISQPFRASSSGSSDHNKPPAPQSYTAHLGHDTIHIDSHGRQIPFELYTQDLLYACEGATNQLVAARGNSAYPVENGVYQQTGSFRVKLDPYRQTDTDFTLQQLRTIINVLFEFGETFNVRDTVFTYKVDGKLRHVVGYLQLNGRGLAPVVGSNRTDAELPMMIAGNASASSVGARGALDPFSIPAWDVLRVHPPATVTFSNYGADIPFVDMADAVFEIYYWIWTLILHSRMEDFNVILREPLLEDEYIKVDIKGDESGWLPLWAVRSLMTNVFHFWMDGQMREVSMKYEDQKGRTMWGYMTRGETRPLPPPGRVGNSREEGTVAESR